MVFDVVIFVVLTFSPFFHLSLGSFFPEILKFFFLTSVLFIQILRRKSPYGGHEREELGLPDVRASLGRHRELHPRHEPPGLKTNSPTLTSFD